MEQNHIELIGCPVCAPVYSHSNHGRQFFRFELEVMRLSGAVDRLPVLAPGELLERCPIDTGDALQIRGQLRSFNNRCGSGRKLVISVLAEELCPSRSEHENRVFLQGVICKEPIYRRTPLGREICDVMLAVNRAYRRADYLPCILWGRCAQDAAVLPVGAVLQLEGRLQSRDYIKIIDGTPQQRTAYEISAITAYSPREDECDE